MGSCSPQVRSDLLNPGISFGMFISGSRCGISKPASKSLLSTKPGLKSVALPLALTTVFWRAPVPKGLSNFGTSRQVVRNAVFRHQRLREIEANLAVCGDV